MPFSSTCLNRATHPQVFTYPMEMYVMRHVLDIAMFQSMLGKGPMTSARHYALTVGIWALTMILALSTDNLGSILEIFGAFAGNVSAPPSPPHPPAAAAPWGSYAVLSYRAPGKLCFCSRSSLVRVRFVGRILGGSGLSRLKGEHTSVLLLVSSNASWTGHSSWAELVKVSAV